MKALTEKQQELLMLLLVKNGLQAADDPVMYGELQSMLLEVLDEMAYDYVANDQADCAEIHYRNGLFGEARLCAHTILLLLTVPRPATGRAYKILGFDSLSRGQLEEGRMCVQRAIYHFRKQEQHAQLEEVKDFLRDHSGKGEVPPDVCRYLMNLCEKALRSLELAGIPT